ncbi:hypothetical protein FXV91_05315 [Methanosarcina sp. DH2]|nr:hypothetical protein [Methanosarcina sp. DH2]
MVTIYQTATKQPVESCEKVFRTAEHTAERTSPDVRRTEFLMIPDYCTRLRPTCQVRKKTISKPIPQLNRN